MPAVTERGALAAGVYLDFLQICNFVHLDYENTRSSFLFHINVLYIHKGSRTMGKIKNDRSSQVQEEVVSRWQHQAIQRLVFKYHFGQRTNPVLFQGILEIREGLCERHWKSWLGFCGNQ